MLKKIDIGVLIEIATRFFQKYPVTCEVFFNDIASDIVPGSCPIATKVRKTGMVVKVTSKADQSTCQTCALRSTCPIGSACFAPILYKQRVIGFIVITSKTEKADWLVGNMGEIEEQLDLCSGYISMKLENDELKMENSQFIEEMNGFFTFVRDPLLLVGRDGMIHNISQGLSNILAKSKTEIVGMTFNQVFKDSDWLKIRRIAGQGELEISLEGKKKKENYLAKVKSITSDGQVISYLIQFIPILDNIERMAQNKVLYSFNDIKGTSHAIQSVIEVAKRVAPSDSSILLRGESGTGKEIFAQSIHQESARKDGPFIALNCAAIPENLLESELFGHVKGSFTGSNANRAGRFELANGGTIFLDEIGDLTLPLQAKLLRVVQERKIERVGDTKSTPVDVRIITATHRNLEELVSQGEFRGDLYYRLNVIPITIPPLRERKEDIPLLVEYFLKSFSKQLSRSPKRLSKDVYEILLHYHWMGNIRELQNVVHHFVQLEIGDLVTVKSLPQSLGNPYSENPFVYQQSPMEKLTNNNRQATEKDEIIKLLDQFGRDTTGKRRVAEKMKISLPTLYRRINKLRIK
ncbi:sigma-54 interaction domain-containing protein [Cytobacillus purgationiresistens]|uniref:Transcriptional regulator with PAS, ATPase and Fis domain n=1 Tax=Cytobacillus purgationiresistens TaxID=863449 RepID=A0ABU0AP30_9BACI|nr:sigma 54-interacting transcriptional regulator [Cytobacillus purgationiresistens]MDQ0272790.1 transcriptional regulator with PAS, ATPase and Fis domain [Cytobacillus purgationiresistens]